MDLLDDILSSMDKNKRPALSQPDKMIQSELFQPFDLNLIIHKEYFSARNSECK